MIRNTVRQLVLIGALGGAIGATPIASSRALAAEPPAPTPTAAKTKPGCCCYPNKEAPDGWACTWGWQESRCKSVAEDLKKVKITDGQYRWNEGRCPPSGSPAASPTAASAAP